MPNYAEAVQDIAYCGLSYGLGKAYELRCEPQTNLSEPFVTHFQIADDCQVDGDREVRDRPARIEDG